MCTESSLSDNKEQYRQLYEAIMDFSIDEPGVAQPFEVRLAAENGWSLPFARAVVKEYKKFVFLAMVAGHMVTPSDEVDQAWHLHLTYTRSYWDRFCKDVLPRPLHHDPTQGGDEEQAKYVEWYTKTLNSYRRILGEEPSTTIWPPVSERFGPKVRFQRVNLQKYWVLSKKRMGVGVAMTLLIGLIMCLFFGQSPTLGQSKDWTAHNVSRAIKNLDYEDTKFRKLAVDTLIKIGGRFDNYKHRPQVLVGLRKALKDSDVEIRKHVVQSLDGLRYGTAELYKLAANDESPSVRALAVSGLVRRYKLAHQPLIQQALLDESAQVRKAAIDALVESGVAKYASIDLSRLKNDPDPEVRQAVNSAFTKDKRDHSTKRNPRRAQNSMPPACFGLLCVGFLAVIFLGIFSKKGGGGGHYGPGGFIGGGGGDGGGGGGCGGGGCGGGGCGGGGAG